MSVSSEVKRTLVKSPPELWSELSDAESLGRHLEGLREITVTRAEPETAVDWRADGASGSVRLQPSGFGTKVTLSLTRELPEPRAVEPEPVAPVSEPEPVAEMPEPESVAEEEPEPQLGFFARLFRRRKKEQRTPNPLPEPEPEPMAMIEPDPIHKPEHEPVLAPEQVAELASEPEPNGPIVDTAADLAALEAQLAERDTELLTAMLDRLGTAHHRPFSRG